MKAKLQYIWLAVLVILSGGVAFLWVRGWSTLDRFQTSSLWPRVVLVACFNHIEIDVCWYRRLDPGVAPAPGGHESEPLLPYYESWADVTQTTHAIIDDTDVDRSFLGARYRSGIRDTSASEAPVPGMEANWSSLVLPDWMLAIPIWFLTVLRAFACFRLWRRATVAGVRCPNCGYDLRAHGAGEKCPECGQPVLPTGPASARASKGER